MADPTVVTLVVKKGAVAGAGAALADGEPALDTSTGKLYVGLSGTNILIGPVSAGGGTVTSVGAIAPLLSSGGTTPTISLNLTLSGTNTGDQTITLTGDVTGSGTGSFATTIANDAVTEGKIASTAVTTAKIANDAVTYAKLQNVSATDRLLGRDTAAAGDVEELTVSNGIAFTGSGITLDITGLTADASPDTAADYFATYDASATTNKKVLLSTLLNSVNTLSGAFFLTGDISDTLLLDKNNYEPTGLSTASVIYLTPDGGADKTITGIYSGGVSDGKMLFIVNESSTLNVILANQSGSSDAANRFILPQSSDVTLLPLQGIILRFGTSLGATGWYSFSRELGVNVATAYAWTAAHTHTVAGLTDTWTNTSDSASVQVVIFQGDRATMADGDEAYISFRLSDDAGTQKEVARVSWVATDVNAGTNVDGRIDFAVMTAGTLADELQLDGTALSPSTSDGLALGTASLMFSDAYFASGAVVYFNGTDVTITHSANKLDIDGGVVDFGSTPTVADAAIYFTGGTDVTVADGGTGRSSHTAYAVLCGGTTTTAAQQSIASVGSAGQVLTSNGAGALPTFQAAMTLGKVLMLSKGLFSA